MTEKSKHRQFSVFVAFIVIFALFSALSFERLYHSHECSGEDCAVCLCIEAVKSNLRTFNAGVGSLAICLFCLISFSFFVNDPQFCELLTLVSQKIKLND